MVVGRVGSGSIWFDIFYKEFVFYYKRIESS